MRRSVLLFLALCCGLCASARPLETAHRLYFSGDPEAALARYMEHFASVPDPRTAENAAFVSRELGRHRAGIQILEDAARLFPDDAALLTELGWALLNEGFILEAATPFARAITLENAPPAARLGLGIALLEGGDLSAAEEHLKAVTAAEPRWTLAHHYLGRLHEAAGRTAEAIETHTETLRLDSHFVEVRPRLGWLYEKTDQPDKAYQQFARAANVHAANSAVRAGLARTRPRITQAPETLIRTRVFETTTEVPAVPDPETLPVIRVGIGTSPTGRPTRKEAIGFFTAHPFELADEGTGAVRARGGAGELWSIRLNRSRNVAEVFDPSGAVVFRYTGSILLRQPEAKNATAVIKRLAFAAGMPWGGHADKELRGVIEFTMNRTHRRLGIINHVNMEEYVYGVLAAEMPSHWPMEALKAQAVITRTIGIYRTRHFRPHARQGVGYDLCDEQHCQVYTGVAAENDRARRATDETGGEVLYFGERAAHTVFSANCGGHTQTGTQAGWGAVAYWRAVNELREGDYPATPMALAAFLDAEPPVHCAGSQYIWHGQHRWVRVVPAEDIAEKLRPKQNVGRVRQIYILGRNPTGRVVKARIIGTNGAVTLEREHEIRRYLGMGPLRSTLFIIDTVVRDERAQAFIFRGGGWGHGVGLCQSGAAGRAEIGHTYRSILEAYYPVTHLTTVVR